jgi:hypothetical protein
MAQPRIDFDPHGSEAEARVIGAVVNLPRAARTPQDRPPGLPRKALGCPRGARACPRGARA